MFILNTIVMSKIILFQSILEIKQMMRKWNRDILLQVNETEAKEVRKRFESSDLHERFLAFLSRKNKL